MIDDDAIAGRDVVTPTGSPSSRPEV